MGLLHPWKLIDSTVLQDVLSVYEIMGGLVLLFSNHVFGLIDKQTGRDYEYRREWVVERLEALSHAFSILASFTGNETNTLTTGVPHHLLDYIELVEWTGRALVMTNETELIVGFYLYSNGLG